MAVPVVLERSRVSFTGASGGGLWRGGPWKGRPDFLNVWHAVSVSKEVLLLAGIDLAKVALR
ncbi:conserved hypothetical protein [Streptomyces sp. SPB78]|nr:conserved hypothetical protein [Streptomyces sp. SPB78]